MIVYAFKERPLTIKKADKADPQKIGEALAKITAANGGHLKPDPVWKAAQNPRNPLHKHFEWDVQKAAEAHWRDTARVLIRSITVEDSDGDQKPAYFSINEKAGVSYRSYEDVISNADLQMAVLKSAERDLKAFQSRYRELADICDIVRDARERVSDRIRRQEARASA